MALIDTYKNNLQRKREALSKLISDKAKVQKKQSDYTTKAQKAEEAASRSKNAATIRNKTNESIRNQKDANQEGDKLAALEKKIAAKHKEIERAEKSVSDEEKKINKKSEKERKKVNQTLSTHDRLHAETRLDLEYLKRLPEKVTVAFFATNPLDQGRLRLDEEVRSIQEMLRKTQHSDSITLKSFWAVRPKDILQALNECNPAIIHFSGHGFGEDELVLQDEKGNTKLVSKEAIVQIMMTFAEGIRLVFFNTCYSRAQAEAVVQHVEAAIGMDENISDDAARIFSSQFYSAIGFGRSVLTAFEQAKALLMAEGIHEEDVPELFCREGLNPNELVIVRPENVN